MKRTLLCAAILIIAAPALASQEILPISGMGYLSYDVASGKVIPEPGLRGFGPTIWAATQMSGYFAGMELGELILDWGDIEGPEGIGGIGFTEYTNSQADDGDAWAYIMIYANENGWNSTGRIALAGFLIENIPTSTHPPNEYWGYIWEVKTETPFILDGEDLDLDGLVDFGYAQWFVWPTPDALMGPSAAGDPNCDPPTSPGIEDAADFFIDPNLFTDPNLIEGYNGTYFFAGDPFFQFYFELFAPACQNAGESGNYCSADIDGSFDCVVGLRDLAQLLSNYGTLWGATLLDGDIEPYGPWFPGDGDVDVADLAELLSQYGDDCN